VCRRVRVASAGPRGAADLAPDNSIVERFRKTTLDEVNRIAFRKRFYAMIDDLQADLDIWSEFKEENPHQREWCFEKASMQPSLKPNTAQPVPGASSSVAAWR
jgi:hypothetical protein